MKPLFLSLGEAIDLVSVIVARMVSTIVGYGFNLLVFIDVDNRLTMYYSRHIPPRPWTWSLLIELLHSIISRCDAEKYGFLFCGRPSLLLLETISSLENIEFIALNPWHYTLDELHVISRIFRENDVFLATIISGEHTCTSGLHMLLRIFCDRLKYLSTGCGLEKIYGEKGLNGILELIKKLVVIAGRT